VTPCIFFILVSVIIGLWSSSGGAVKLCCWWLPLCLLSCAACGARLPAWGSCYEVLCIARVNGCWLTVWSLFIISCFFRFLVLFGVLLLYVSWCF